MARYQLLIEYVGTDFRGWQIQKKGSTIQGLIQEKLTKLLKEKIILNGSGRTDTGVHAIEQSGHFDCKNEIKDLSKFLKSINYFLNDQGVAKTAGSFKIVEDGTVMRFTGIATKTSKTITAEVQAQTPDANPGAEPEVETQPEAIAI